MKSHNGITFVKLCGQSAFSPSFQAQLVQHMKLFATSHVFPFPWHTLTTANWRKYPNDMAQHVISCDVIDRHVDERGVLHTERLIVCKQNAPSIMRRFGVSDIAYFREVSTLDPSGKEYTATTVNMSLTNICTVVETCSFIPDPNHPIDSTLFEQRGNVTAGKALSALGRLVEEAAVNRFYSNAHVGRAALQSVIDMVVAEAKEFECTLSNGFDQLKKEWSDNVGNSLVDQVAGHIDKSLDQISSSIDPSL